MKLILKLLLSIVLLVALVNASEKIPSKEEVSKLYVATFNRAPDSAGLDYWVNDSGLSLSGIAKSFFEQIETKTLYPTGTSNGSFIDSVYQNLFNRAPDSGGYDYWKRELDSGIAKRDYFILMVINGAKDNADGMDRTILNNKNEVGLYFANAGLEDIDHAKSIMRLVTHLQSTVDAAKNSINNLPRYSIETNKNAKIIKDNSEILSKLELSSVNTNTLVINDTTLNDIDYKKGDILAFKETSKTPSGLLKKIKSITSKNGNLVIEVEQASLAEFIKDGNISLEVNLDSPIENTLALARKTNTTVKYAKVISALDGVTLTKNQISTKDRNSKDPLMSTLATSFTYTMDLKNVYLDNEKNIELNGKIEFSISLVFNAEFAFFKLKKLIYTITPKQEAGLTLTFVGISQEIKKQITLATYRFPPIAAGPVLLTPKVKFNVGIDGELSTGITTGVSENVSATVGVEYSNSKWNIIKSLENDFEAQSPTFSASASLKLYTGPEVELDIYEVVGPTANLEVYLKAEADTLATPWWEIYAGIDAKVGVELEIFDHALIDVDFTVLDYSKILMQADGGFLVTCDEDEKNQNGVCIVKTCEDDGYGCPACNRGEILNYYADGSGYCEVESSGGVSVGITNKIIYQDDFSDDLSNWNKYGGSWSINNDNSLYANYGIGCGSTTCPQADLIVSEQYQPTGDYKASVDFKRIVDATHSDYYQALTQFSIWKNSNKKMYIFIGGTGWEYWGGNQTKVRVAARSWDNGSWGTKLFDEIYDYDWNPDDWNKASIIKNDSTYSLYINDKFLTSFTDTFLDGEGKIGLHTYGTKLLDNFIIKLLD